ncbi:hypothetical protein Q1695_009625 [Nippostrongylus brasiliensis]|nr:hypothetical protein Q1695_009625 [Nippostrongylus brasiliensis]
MQLLLTRDIPVAPLLTTFRAHPALNELPNRMFYGGELRSGTTPSQRAMLADTVRLPIPDVPCVVVAVPGTSLRSPGGSHSNLDEARCCQDITSALLARGVPSSSVAIIVFYKDQMHALASFASAAGVALHTVDSIQGREADIVLLLTTRTDISPETGDFLDDAFRFNVAITRCRHGLFVLGSPSALSTLPNWGRLLDWASHHGILVDLAALQNMFA